MKTGMLLIFWAYELSSAVFILGGRILSKTLCLELMLKLYAHTMILQVLNLYVAFFFFEIATNEQAFESGPLVTNSHLGYSCSQGLKFLNGRQTV